MRARGFALNCSLVVGLSLSFFAPPGALAAKLHVLYSFRGGNDGEYPQAPLTLDAAGDLYGTATKGGANGLGTVFKLAIDGTFTTLHAFARGNDGRNPNGALHLTNRGDLYGMTQYGGAYGYGTVFKLSARGRETVVHSFGSGTDGGVPYGGLIEDKDHNLYGTTIGGGAHGYGTVFSLARDDSETVLYAFDFGDGANPCAGLVRDSAGNLYGTTNAGGTGGGYGTVFALAPDGTETVLHSFGTGDGGLQPTADLKQDDAGNLYGTTSLAPGNVFEVAPDGTFTVLYAFTGGNDGSGTVAGVVGNRKVTALYGTTVDGGVYGYGVVYKLVNGSLTVLHAFKGGSDGSYPDAALVRDGNGTLYGTTNAGGANGYGTIFALNTK